MPREFSRNRRVADLIQRELAPLVQRFIQNEDAGLVTVSSVDVSPDLKNARVFFTCLANRTDIKQVEDQLNDYARQFRHELSQNLPLRSVPRISFSYDHSLERANRLSSLIDSLHTNKPDNEQ